VYVKLFSSILTSSVWGEDMATRIVWITLLALSDKDGNVRSSPSGLARMANVTPDQCNAALLKFLSPDPESGSDEQEGRRIEAIPAGWFIINYAKYRDLQDAETRRAQWRESSRKHRQQTSAKRQQPSAGGQQESAPTEAVAVTEVYTKDTHAALDDFCARLPATAQPLVRQMGSEQRNPEAWAASMVAILDMDSPRVRPAELAVALTETAATDAKPSPANVRAFLRRFKLDAAKDATPANSAALTKAERFAAAVAAHDAKEAERLTAMEAQ